MRVRTWWKTVVGLPLTAMMLFPIYWMVSESLTRDSELRKSPPAWIPLRGTLDGYRTVVRISPSSRSHQQLANALAQLKHYDEAVAELRAAQRFEDEAGVKALEDAIAALEALRDAEAIRAKGL